MEDEKIEVSKKQWMALQIWAISSLVRYGNSFAYRISMDSFKEWGKWILDNNVHLLVGHADDHVLISVVEQDK